MYWQEYLHLINLKVEFNIITTYLPYEDKMKDYIINMINRISSTIKNFDVQSYITDNKKLPITLIFAVIIIILIVNMGITHILKGVLMLAIFYFIFFVNNQ